MASGWTIFGYALPKEEAANTRPSCVIHRLHKHLLHVGEARLSDIVLPEGVQLPRGDLVLLDPVCLDAVRAHVFDEAARDRRR